jgi:hypothetical protein
LSYWWCDHGNLLNYRRRNHGYRDVNAQQPENGLAAHRVHGHHRAGSGNAINHHRHDGGDTKKTGDAILQKCGDPFPGGGGIGGRENGQQEPVPVGGDDCINRRKVCRRRVDAAGGENQRDGGLSSRSLILGKPGRLVTELTHRRKDPIPCRGRDTDPGRTTINDPRHRRLTHSSRLRNNAHTNEITHD